MKIFLSHTSGCTGWKMEDIFENTIFEFAHRTGQRPFKNVNCRMLDFDYRKYKNAPGKIKKKHLEYARSNNYEVIMSMDLWRDNLEECIRFTEELEKYCDRVLIPVHFFHENLNGYEFALPNANWFEKNPAIPIAARSKITHLLGGSPHSHLRKILNTENDFWGNSLSLTNIKSVDGNQIFRVAIKGKFWAPVKPFWFKPFISLSNEQIFTISVNNVNEIFKML